MNIKEAKSLKHGDVVILHSFEDKESIFDCWYPGHEYKRACLIQKNAGDTYIWSSDLMSLKSAFLLNQIDDLTNSIIEKQRIL